MHEISGLPISPGLARGRAVVYEDVALREHESYDIGPAQIRQEFRRIANAIEEELEVLPEQARRIEEDLGAELAGVFRAQEAILRDPTLAERLQGVIEQDLVNAEQVVKRVFRLLHCQFGELSAPALRARGDDVGDIEGRLLKRLAGIQGHELEDLPPGSVVVAHRLLPSDTILLARGGAGAAIVELGGPASHASLMAREMGIPAVARAVGIMETVNDGDLLLVDGYRGTVAVDPSDEQLDKFNSRMIEDRRLSEGAWHHRHEAAVTPDGTRVRVFANTFLREDAQLAAESGAEGIGLYRIEGIYLSRQLPPQEDELFEEMSLALGPMGNMPIVVRLLDAGGDKQMAVLDYAESDPFLGLRGVRLLLKHPGLALPQARTLLRLSKEFDIRALVPMVTVAEEMIKVREWFNEASRETGIPCSVPIGAMIETPAAALCTRSIAAESDFLSIGTNDLTQYTMVAGRENSTVVEYFDDGSPAVMRLVRIVCEEAGDLDVGLCGELARRPDILPELIRMGVSSVSVAPPWVPATKEAIRHGGCAWAHQNGPARRSGRGL